MSARTARFMAATILAVAVAAAGILVGYFTASNTLAQAPACMEGCK